MIAAVVQDLANPGLPSTIVYVDDSRIVNAAKARQIATYLRANIRGVVVSDPVPMCPAWGHSIDVKTADTAEVITAIKALSTVSTR